MAKRIYILISLVFMAAVAFFITQRAVIKEQQVNSIYPKKDKIEENLNIKSSLVKESKGLPLEQSKGIDFNTNRFLTAKNIKNLIDEAYLEKVGEGKILVIKAEAISECSNFSSDPDYIKNIVNFRTLKSNDSKNLIEYYAKKTAARCADFSLSEKMTRNAMENFYNEAGKHGDIEAIAHILNREINQQLLDPSRVSMSVRDIKDAMLSVVLSGDPSAIFAMSDSFNENSIFGGPASGSAIASAAWQLAACDLGLDCSQGGVLLGSFCLAGGIYCGSGDLRENLRNSQFTPYQFKEVVKLEGDIYASIKSGNIKKLFANN